MGKKISYGINYIYLYAQVEESLYNRLIGHYKSVAYQAVSITLPKRVVMVLYMVSSLVLSTAKNIHLGTKTWTPRLPLQPCGRSYG